MTHLNAYDIDSVTHISRAALAAFTDEGTHPLTAQMMLTNITTRALYNAIVQERINGTTWNAIEDFLCDAAARSAYHVPAHQRSTHDHVTKFLQACGLTDNDHALFPSDPTPYVEWHCYSDCGQEIHDYGPVLGEKGHTPECLRYPTKDNN